ncbi:MAG: efflux RND transporter periplasmic adaptor subunit [Nannocystaceae bacterium]|nr:efflux RND transporter periplasmic adaptor subunit [Myxococcales bacterium]
MNRIAWALASLLVLAGAGGIAFFFVSTRPEAAEIERERPRIAVEVLRARPSDNPVTVTAMGEVQAAHQLVLQPEISGRVVARADNLVPGGLVERGEGLVRIDGRDLKAVIAAQEAAVAQAKVQLADERGRKQVAASDWEGRVDDLNDHAKQFALREPHIESAQASLGSSKTQLTKARRDLSRSRVQAPFDALVIDAPVELGQVVSPQVKLATLVAVDRYWVQVSVPVSHLEFLAIPGVNTKSDGGSRAQVVHNSGGVFIERPGHVERLEGAVDSRGRMAKLLVAIDDPLQLAKPESERGLPLLLGSYVRVALAGTVAQDTVALPREALRDGNSVFLVVDGKLMPQPIEIAWRTRESVLVRGLSEGDLVVISPLAAPTEGMEVTVSEEHSEFGAPGREELVNVAPAPAGGNKD